MSCKPNCVFWITFVFFFAIRLVCHVFKTDWLSLKLLAEVSHGTVPNYSPTSCNLKSSLTLEINFHKNKNNHSFEFNVRTHRLINRNTSSKWRIVERNAQRRSGWPFYRTQTKYLKVDSFLDDILELWLPSWTPTLRRRLGRFRTNLSRLCRTLFTFACYDSDNSPVLWSVSQRHHPTGIMFN